MITLFLMVVDTLKINLEQAKETALQANPGYRSDALSHTYSKFWLYEKLGSSILNPSVRVGYSGVEYPPEYFRPTGYSSTFSIDQPVFDLSQCARVLQSKFESGTAGDLREEAEEELFFL